MNLKVKLPTKASGKSLRVCFESIHRQWSNRSGTVRLMKISEDQWLELMIGPQLYPGEIGYTEPEKAQLVERDGLCDLSFKGLTADELVKAFQLVGRRIDLYESQNRCLAEIEFLSGDTFSFHLKPTSWQVTGEIVFATAPRTPAPNESAHQSAASQPEAKQAKAVAQQAEQAAQGEQPALKMPTSPSLLIIDGNNILSRCYWATAYNKEEHQLMKSSKGIYTNAIGPLVDKLSKVIRKYAPTNLVVVWDPPGGRATLWRRELFGGENYKANRDGKEEPISYTQQKETAKALFDAMNIKQHHVDRYEADDLAGIYSHQWTHEVGAPCYLYSNDKDFHQLLDHNVIQIVEDEPFDLAIFTEKYEGITPLQFIDYKALSGDTGDNISGIPGVGRKGALALLKAHGNLEGIFAAVENGSLDPIVKRYQNALKEGRESGYISRKLATIVREIPEMGKVVWEDLLTKINKTGYQAMMTELEIKPKSNAS